MIQEHECVIALNEFTEVTIVGRDEDYDWHIGLVLREWFMFAFFFVFLPTSHHSQIWFTCNSYCYMYSDCPIRRDCPTFDPIGQDHAATPWT